MSLANLRSAVSKLLQHPWIRALREVLVNALMGLAPVWMGLIISVVLSADGLSASLMANLARGDLFLGATTIAAPVALYLTARRLDIPSPFSMHFPMGTTYLVILFVLYATSIILFVIKRLKDMSIITMNIQEQIFLPASISLFFISILLTYAVTATRFTIDQADASMFRNGQDEFDAQWERRVK